MERRSSNSAENLRRNNGIYYTPKDLAYFLAKEVVHSYSQKILDPCFGDGILLDAASKVLYSLGINNVAKRLYGCEIKHNNRDTLCRSVQGANLKECDFFDFSANSGQKFNTIIMNPPFVRHHRINKNHYANVIASSCDLYGIQRRADLWVYFILKALTLLEKGGNVAAILPWTFLFADYAKKVRELVSSNFRSIETIVIGKQLFKNAQERILVLILKDFGKKASIIKTAFTNDAPSGKFNSYDSISTSEWVENPFIPLRNSKVNQLFSKAIKDDNWLPLSYFADVRIGIVTGSNSHFLLTQNNIKELKLPKKYFQPIITSSKDLNTDSVKRTVCRKYLLSLDSKTIKSKNILRYIIAMKKAGIHRRIHPKRRNPWYSVQVSPPSDAFLPCMSTETPYLIFNQDKLQCTNSIHKIFFKPFVTNLEKKWIGLSVLSSISQLSIEAYSKTYGGGVLKLEPSCANKILVHKGNGEKIPKRIEQKIERCLLNGHKEKAVELATKYIVEMQLIDKNIAGKAMELKKLMYTQRRSK